MAEKRRGLGRGLGALIATGPTDPVEDVKPQEPTATQESVSDPKTTAAEPAASSSSKTKATPREKEAASRETMPSTTEEENSRVEVVGNADSAHTDAKKSTETRNSARKQSKKVESHDGNTESKSQKSAASSVGTDSSVTPAEPSQKSNAEPGESAPDVEDEGSTSVAEAVDVLRKRTSERRRKALENTIKKPSEAPESSGPEQEETKHETGAQTGTSPRLTATPVAAGAEMEDETQDHSNDTEDVPRMRPVDMFFGGSTSRNGNVSRETSRGARKRAQVPDLLTARAARVLKNREELANESEANPDASSQPETQASDQGSIHVSRETSAALDGENGTKSPSNGQHTEPDGAAESDKAAREETAEELKAIAGLAYAELDIHSIHPNRKQPRQVFDEDDMAELEHSIREVGLLQPIVVRPSSEPGEPQYELVMGERRWRAAQRVGLETIPAIIRDTKDEDLLRDALLENLHRSELNPLEEAAAYQQLLQEFGCSQDELSQKIGRSRSQISNTIRLMKLPPLVQRRVAAGVISQGHARALLALEDVADMERLAQRIVNEGLSVRSVEEIVALQAGLRRADNKKQQKEVARPERLDYFANALSDRLDTQVKITLGAKKGRVSIEFASVDDLNRIMGVIAPSN